MTSHTTVLVPLLLYMYSTVVDYGADDSLVYCTYLYRSQGGGNRAKDCCIVQYCHVLYCTLNIYSRLVGTGIQVGLASLHQFFESNSPQHFLLSFSSQNGFLGSDNDN